jgi:hypothetical protein
MQTDVVVRRAKVGTDHVMLVEARTSGDREGDVGARELLAFDGVEHSITAISERVMAASIDVTVESGALPGLLAKGSGTATLKVTVSTPARTSPSSSRTAVATTCSTRGRGTDGRGRSGDPARGTRRRPPLRAAGHGTARTRRVAHLRLPGRISQGLSDRARGGGVDARRSSDCSWRCGRPVPRRCRTACSPSASTRPARSGRSARRFSAASATTTSGPASRRSGRSTWTSTACARSSRACSATGRRGRRPSAAASSRASRYASSLMDHMTALGDTTRARGRKAARSTRRRRSSPSCTASSIRGAAFWRGGHARGDGRQRPGQEDLEAASRRCSASSADRLLMGRLTGAPAEA